MKKQSLSVLFTSAGRRVELISCFAKAADEIGISLITHACDLNSKLSAACQVAQHRFDVPRCSAPGYIDILIEYCRNHNIDLLVPTIDPELHLLAKAKDRFAAIGTMVHVSGPKTIEIVRDKATTASVLKDNGVPVPKTAYSHDVRQSSEGWDWPAFIKPSGGSASRGIAVIESADQIQKSYDEPMIVQQLLDGDEYTVNIFVDAHGRLETVIPHKRLSVRAGEVEKGITVRRSDIDEIARRIVAAMPDAEGVMCFQLIDDKQHGPLVFEINARFGGGYPLADYAGGDYAARLLRQVLGVDGSAPKTWREGVTMLRYDAAVFLD